jgi:hypothetical protein
MNEVHPKGRVINMSETKRLTVEFSAVTATRLDEMKHELGAKSLVDVIRMSVQVLSFILKEEKDGWEMVLRKGDKEQKPVLVGSGR